jgi:glycosyltransferase involved in cell wall biosynthesis
MNALPLVSVVVPCYNAAPYVRETLASVFAQEGVRLEVLVVDDGSSDDSATLVAAAYPQVRLIRQANAGVAAARNNGLRHATGQWVAFVDADDYWLPGKLRAQLALLAADPSARMAYSAWVVWESSIPRPDPCLLAGIAARAGEPARWGGPSGWIYPQLLLDCEVWTSTVLAERALFDQIGGFDESLHIGEDYDLWLRASRVTPILRLPEPTALYRMHAANTTRKAQVMNHQAAVVERALRLWGYAGPDGGVVTRRAVRASLARTWRNLAGANLQSGNKRVAARGAAKAVMLDPRHVGGWKLLARAIFGT